MTQIVDVLADSMLRFSPNAPSGFVREVRLRLTQEALVYGHGPKPTVKRTCLLGQDEYSLFAPRGAVWDLAQAAKRHGVTLDWQSEVTTGPGEAIPVDDLGVTPRDYQIRAVEFLHSRVQGVVVLPCGGGKTTIGIVGILTLGQPALVIVPTTDLVDQWAERLKSAGAALVRKSIRMSKPARPGEVIVSTAAAFQNGRGADVLASVGVLVVDECHRAPAPTWGDVVGRCPARYRWGLTATLERADGLEWTLPKIFGDVEEPATTEELIGAGWLRRPSVYGIEIGWSPGPELFDHYCSCPGCGIDWTLRGDEFPWNCAECGAKITEDRTLARPKLIYAQAMSELVAAPEFTGALLRLAAAASDAGRSVLVLVPRKSVGVDLKDSLVEIGHDAEFVSSRSGKSARARAMTKMRDGRLSVLVATSLADEGLDIPNLDCVILAASGKAKGKAKQRAGRAARPQGDDPIVFDLVAGGPFVNQWLSRKKAYVAEYGAACIIGGLISDTEAALLFGKRETAA